MFLGMQDLILPKSNQICPNLTNFDQNSFAKSCGCIPVSYGTGSASNFMV